MGVTTKIDVTCDGYPENNSYDRRGTKQENCTASETLNAPLTNKGRIDLPELGHLDGWVFDFEHGYGDEKRRIVLCPTCGEKRRKECGY